MNKVWVWDLDETLLDNMHAYSQPLLDAVSLIVHTLGSKAPHVQVIMQKEHETDSRRVKEINPVTGKQFLYSMERFPGSLVEVYVNICTQVGVKPNGSTCEELYAIGLEAFSESWYSQNIHPAAKKVINFLQKQDDKLVLCTKGDVRVQAKKIKALDEHGVRGFSSIRIVDTKNVATFEEIAIHFPARVHISVGDNYNSDIEPALQAGYKGILIPRETWELIGKMDDILSQVDRTRCEIVQDLADIPSIYGRL